MGFIEKQLWPELNLLTQPLYENFAPLCKVQPSACTSSLSPLAFASLWLMCKTWLFIKEASKAITTFNILGVFFAFSSIS